jgi:hypothetical protein
MAENWKTIEGDDHVLSFNGDTLLKLDKYKQELKDEYQKYITSKLFCGKHPISNYKYNASSIFHGQLTCLHWSSYPTECKLLLLGKEEWDAGKLKAKIKVEFFAAVEELKDVIIDNNILISKNIKYSDLYSIEIIIEFSSDNNEPATKTIDSALDDIRQRMTENIR